MFLGVWDSTLSPSIGNACIWYNKVFVNQTGNVGTADGIPFRLNQLESD